MKLNKTFPIVACAIVYQDSDNVEHLTCSLGASKAEALGALMLELPETAVVISKVFNEGVISFG